MFLGESDSAGRLALSFGADIVIRIVADSGAHAGQRILERFQRLDTLPVFDLLIGQFTALFE